MDNELKKNTLIFGIGTIGSKIIQFFLVPLYTGFLTSYEYGIADTIISSMSLLVPLLTIGIGNGVLRFTIGQKKNQVEVFTISFFICVFGTLLLLILIPIYREMEYFSNYYMYIPFLYFVYSLKDILSNFCKGIGKNKIYIIDSMLNSIVLTVLSFVLIAKFKKGISGYIVATFITYLISVFFLFYKCNALNNIRCSGIKKNFLKEMVLYSIPLMPNGIFWWMIQLLDRYIVLWKCGPEANGIYSISYKIPSIFNLVISIFIQAFGISAIKECERQSLTNKKYNGFYFNSIYEKYVAVSFVSASVILILTRPLSSLLLKNEFYEAWKYTPFLLFSYLFGNFQSFYGIIFSGIKKTKDVLLTTFVSCIVNMILNIILINYYGILGAAISTVISYAIIYFLRVTLIRKYIDMNHNIKKISFSLIMYFIMVINYVYLGRFGTIICIVLSFIYIVIYKKEIISILDSIKIDIYRFTTLFNITKYKI